MKYLKFKDPIILSQITQKRKRNFILIQFYILLL